MTKITIENQSQLPSVASEIIGRLEERPVVAFYGEMGAGKTTLIREIATQMGVSDSVSSPTFALVNEYVAADGRSVFHFDFYRIESPTEAMDMGYEEYVYGGDICLIEWPEKIEGLLPDNVLEVRITLLEGGGREFEIGV